MKTYTGKQLRNRKIILALFIFFGFMAMEFPGILIVRGRVEPFIFGLPFLYGYMFVCWLYMCVVMFVAFRTAWGRKSFFGSRGQKS